ncbi:energy-coupling factor transporter transmembrane component T [Fusibacter sp. JL298sf-3]
MKNDVFSKSHPYVTLLFFIAVIGASMVLKHPVFQAINLLAACFYAFALKGGKQVKFSLLYLLPMAVLIVVGNPLFNHEGATILTYLRDGNPLTLESILYGVSSAVMLFSVITWFSCYHVVMTSDKFVYIFGNTVPALSLVLTMALRFVPMYTQKFEEVRLAQKGIGHDVAQEPLMKRLKSAMSILSTMVSWAFEQQIETADSMKARGYGIGNRTAFSIYYWSRRDTLLLVLLSAGIVSLITGVYTGDLVYYYFPVVESLEGSGVLYICTLFYAMVAFCPPIMIVLEELKWKSLK